MAPLVVLVLMTVGARVLGQFGVRSLGGWAVATRVGLAAMFCFTAVAHFNHLRGDLIRMVPPWAPAPGLMVTFTGVCEVLGGIGLLLPQTRKAAAVALIALLIAVLPANLHAARTGMTLGGAPVTPAGPRVAVQALFIALVWWSGIRAAGRKAHERQEG